MYKIRFHLGRGDDFMKWQVKTLVSDGSYVVQYFEPEKYQLAMFDAKLKVQLGTSKKIHEGALGTADLVKPCENDFYVRFNPRNNPNWTDRYSNIMNDEEFEILMTDNRSIFVLTGNHECEE
jgi:hypothetical protein